MKVFWTTETIVSHKMVKIMWQKVWIDFFLAFIQYICVIGNQYWACSPNCEAFYIRKLNCINMVIELRHTIFEGFRMNINNVPVHLKLRIFEPDTNLKSI